MQPIDDVRGRLARVLRLPRGSQAQNHRGLKTSPPWLSTLNTPNAERATLIGVRVVYLVEGEKAVDRTEEPRPVRDVWTRGRQLIGSRNDRGAVVGGTGARRLINCSLMPNVAASTSSCAGGSIGFETDRDGVMHWIGWSRRSCGGAGSMSPSRAARRLRARLHSDGNDSRGRGRPLAGILRSTDVEDSLGRNVIAAAKTTGVSRVVYTGILNAEHTSNPLAGEHQDTERALRNAGVPFIVLRNGWYTENYTDRLAQYVEAGEIVGAAGHGRISKRSGLDQNTAEFVAALDASISRGDLETDSQDLEHLLGRPVTSLATVIGETQHHA